MVEGTLEIQWTNMHNPSVTRIYWVSFLSYAVYQHGAQPHEEHVGEESLFNYLIDLQATITSIERRTERAWQWLLEIHSAGHLSLDNVQLNDQQFAPFRRAS